MLGNFVKFIKNYKVKGNIKFKKIIKLLRILKL